MKARIKPQYKMRCVKHGCGTYFLTQSLMYKRCPKHRTTNKKVNK